MYMYQTQPDKFTVATNFTMSPSVEGGYTVDNGGPTNYGITQNTLDKYNKSNGYAPMDVSDITPDDAKHVAKDMYYDKVGLDNLPTKTAVAVFDYGYNSGPVQAVKDLQRTVGVEADGKIGHDTINAVNTYVANNGEDGLLNDYISRRTQLMNNLVQQNPAKYGPSALGWAHRITNLQNYLGIGNGQSSDTNT